jgi:hypothetical protein
MEEKRWMRIVLIPSVLAIEHACWPPAPPKHLRAALVKGTININTGKLGTDVRMCFAVA